MLHRDVHLPAGTDAVWTALTEPKDLEDWFGASVEWDLRPGGAAAFRQAEGDREGRVERVEPGRRLSFTWWPTGEEDEASEVTYELAPDGEGTRLTVTERRLPAGAAQASIATWGPADDAQLVLWAADRLVAVA